MQVVVDHTTLSSAAPLVRNANVAANNASGRFLPDDQIDACGSERFRQYIADQREIITVQLCSDPVAVYLGAQAVRFNKID